MLIWLCSDDAVVLFAVIWLDRSVELAELLGSWLAPATTHAQAALAVRRLSWREKVIRKRLWFVDTTTGSLASVAPNNAIAGVVALP